MPAAKTLYRSIFLDDDILLWCLYSWWVHVLTPSALSFTVYKWNDKTVFSSLIRVRIWILTSSEERPLELSWPIRGCCSPSLLTQVQTNLLFCWIKWGNPPPPPPTTRIRSSYSSSTLQTISNLFFPKKELAKTHSYSYPARTTRCCCQPLDEYNP